ncbi:MAG TPA: hypothetical protein VHM20_05415 [Gammaproteobacteria bacterium]|jgi:hypothetical protein|nr:hypothetical protein [Gammaproteobacteria bacterium]
MALSQSIILNNFKNQGSSTDTSTLTFSSFENNNKMQDDLSQIANQATNLGYGSGVALRGAIEKVKTLCKNIEELSLNNHFFNYLFYDNLIYGFFIENERSNKQTLILKQCHESVSELERIEKETTTQHFGNKK